MARCLTEVHDMPCMPKAVFKTGIAMPAFICSACGTQYPPSDAPPAQCPVCEDERQYIPPEGQSWTTLERLRISHHNGFRQYEPGLIGIGTQPKFAIGQRAVRLGMSPSISMPRMPSG